MDKSQERARMGEDNVSDKDTDVTRSENQQRSANADNTEDTSASDDGADRNRQNAFSTGSTTGSHQEGQYDKQSDQSKGEHRSKRDD